ncbi:MAG: hypothetical protein M3083_19395 [Actinomycetota bacterium]|nr:hypothetical protein [Actinomycetota bacterium]
MAGGWAYRRSPNGVDDRLGGIFFDGAALGVQPPVQQGAQRVVVQGLEAEEVERLSGGPFTAKNGFSVVAPTSVRVQSSMLGSSAS